MAKKRAGQERLIRVPAAGSPTDGSRAEDVLRPIVDGITSQVGEQFFRALVRHLAAALKVRFAFISEQLDHEGARVRLVAFWAGDDYGENFEYPTKGTPCAHVVGRGLAFFPAGLRELFPEDAWLREVGAESYLAIPLFDSIGAPLGHLGVMHDAPMREEHLNEQILRIFAERAGSELERNRAEVALRESEERYRELVEEINDVIYEIDTNGRVTYISPIAEEVSGYSPNEIIGRSIVEFMPPEEVPARMDSFGQGLAGRPVPTEFRLVSKSGEIRWIHTLGRVLREGDRITGYRGVLTDITDRKRAEGALRDSEERLKILFESAPDAYYLNDLEGRFVDGNRAAGEISGYKREELIGQSFLSLKLLSPDEISKAAVLLARNAQGEATGPDEFTLNRKDGSQVAVEIRTFVVRIAGEVLVLGIARDITERKRAEEALRESEQQYRALYDDNPTMYFTVDTEGTVLSVNKFGAEQLGYKADELVGRSVLGIFHDDDREDVQEQLAACVRNPAEVAQWEFRKVCKDGSLMWVKETVRAVRGPDGDTIVLIVCDDITERMRVEEALQEAREELESRVETQLQRGNTYGLTFRELTVIHVVAEGKSDKEIGALLSISPRTANKHVQNILKKMGASSRTEVGVRAVREGLVV